MINYKTCPLCNSEKIGSWIQTNDFFLSREPFTLFICSDCGLVFTQDHPDEGSSGRYYESNDYISHNEKAKGFISSVYRLARKFMLRSKRKMITRLTGLRRGDLLDIGSGTGHFLFEMQRKGWKVKGIEINESARAFSVNTHNLEVISPQNIVSLPDSSFDCITLWHVLEHFHYPKAFFSEIQRLLKSTGKCVIALPNCSSFDSDHYKKFWAALDVPRHIWHFSPASFNIFARNSGFQIKAIRRLPLDVFYISILSEKYRGSEFYLIKGIIKGSWFFFKSIWNIKKSSSLVYILNKLPESH
ncbi:MAG: class I SAM-dependent methyltransferase [Bacteroidales bacterium]|nr:class I SAM-dependent methyltransferase [Bacteroidales bacterium]